MHWADESSSHLIVVTKVAALVCVQECQVKARALLGQLLDPLVGGAHDNRHLHRTDHSVVHIAWQSFN